MFDIEKLINDGRWYANSEIIPTCCKTQFAAMADTIEQQQAEIKRLQQMLAPYLSAEYQKL